MVRTEPGASRLSLRRSRGALSGTLILLLGLWGALVPFVGPSFHFGFAPDQSWTWTQSRAWLQVLPGGVAALGGLILLVTANRAVALVGSWLAAAAAAWFIVGPTLAARLHIPAIGSPIRTTTGMEALQWLAVFYGLGALILFLSATAMGRLTVRTAVVVPAAAAEPAVSDAPAAGGHAARPVTDGQRTESGHRTDGGHRNDSAHTHRRFGRRRATADSEQTAAASGDTVSGDTPTSTTGDPVRSG